MMGQRAILGLTGTAHDAASRAASHPTPVSIKLLYCIPPSRILSRLVARGYIHTHTHTQTPNRPPDVLPIWRLCYITA